MNIKGLAKKLNLSITTVSRALGGYSDVSEKTREKVKKYAQKYQYSPNLYASALASGRSKTVGYVLPIYGTHSSALNQANIFEFVSGMSEALLSESIQFQVLFAKSETQELEAYKSIADWWSILQRARPINRQGSRRINCNPRTSFGSF